MWIIERKRIISKPKQKYMVLLFLGEVTLQKYGIEGLKNTGIVCSTDNYYFFKYKKNHRNCVFRWMNGNKQ